MGLMSRFVTQCNGMTWFVMEWSVFVPGHTNVSRERNGVIWIFKDKPLPYLGFREPAHAQMSRPIYKKHLLVMTPACMRAHVRQHNGRDTRPSGLSGKPIRVEKALQSISPFLVQKIILKNLDMDLVTGKVWAK
jgi:hypothetical protein